jgi:hypothetical protein
MRCGALSAANASSGGCGMPLVRRESGMEECRKTLGYTGTP